MDVFTAFPKVAHSTGGGDWGLRAFLFATTGTTP